jgi:hypothetical protein
MFGKYSFALANPRESPQASLKKGGIRLLVPLFKGDLAAFLFGGSPRIKKRQDRGIYDLSLSQIRLSKHPLRKSLFKPIVCSEHFTCLPSAISPKNIIILLLLKMAFHTTSQIPTRLELWWISRNHCKFPAACIRIKGKFFLNHDSI